MRIVEGTGFFERGKGTSRKRGGKMRREKEGAWLPPNKQAANQGDALSQESFAAPVPQDHFRARVHCKTALKPLDRIPLLWMTPVH